MQSKDTLLRNKLKSLPFLLKMLNYKYVYRFLFILFNISTKPFIKVCSRRVGHFKNKSKNLTLISLSLNYLSKSLENILRFQIIRYRKKYFQTFKICQPFQMYRIGISKCLETSLPFQIFVSDTSCCRWIFQSEPKRWILCRLLETRAGSQNSFPVQCSPKRTQSWSKFFLKRMLSGSLVDSNPIPLYKTSV